MLKERLNIAKREIQGEIEKRTTKLRFVLSLLNSDNHNQINGDYSLCSGCIWWSIKFKNHIFH